MCPEPGNPAIHYGQLFDGVAKQYDDARPEYPAEVFEILQTRCGLVAGSRVLEVGAGTGKATLPLLELGARVTAIEPGGNLATELRARAGTRALTVIESTLEAASLETDFDLVVAATSFHWVDPVVAIPKVAAALRARGWFAAWSTLYGDPARRDPFHEALIPLLSARAPEIVAAGNAHLNEAPAWLATLEHSEDFDPVERAVVAWEGHHSGAQLRALFATFSPWLAMPEALREPLLDDIQTLVEESFGDRIVRPYRTEMHLAMRRPI